MGRSRSGSWWSDGSSDAVRSTGAASEAAGRLLLAWLVILVISQSIYCGRRRLSTLYSLLRTIVHVVEECVKRTVRGSGEDFESFCSKIQSIWSHWDPPRLLIEPPPRKKSRAGYVHVHPYPYPYAKTRMPRDRSKEHFLNDRTSRLSCSVPAHVAP